MKKTQTAIFSIVLFFLLFWISSQYVLAKKGVKADCVKIKDKSLVYPSLYYLGGNLLTLGFDPYGYNYQAHSFIGYYSNCYLNRDGFPPYEGDDEAYYQRLVNEGFASDIPGAENLMNEKWYWRHRKVHLMMKWNDMWLSNKDCDGDGLLDRHFGFPSYLGSGAWLTNHQQGTYEVDGKECLWIYFIKIVAVPEDAVLTDGIWYTASGKEIGPVIWGSFAIIQEILNDPCNGTHGVQYVSPAGPGLGKW